MTAEEQNKFHDWLKGKLVEKTTELAEQLSNKNNISSVVDYDNYTKKRAKLEHEADYTKQLMNDLLKENVNNG